MKIVIFDFDGTLTKKHGNFWRKLWQSLGYDIGDGSYYRKLLHEFLNGKLGYQDWCDITCTEFKKKGLTKAQFNKFSQQIKLNNGAEDLFQYLQSRNLEMHILSGNMLETIQNVLQDKTKYFKHISANSFVFDSNGKLDRIVGTKYDHTGKATYIKNLAKHTNTPFKEICFVGNSLNDEYVASTGCKTICINPDETDPSNTKIWNKVIYTDNLMDLKEEIIKQ